MDISKHYNFYEYVIESLKSLGGSGRNEEILEKIIELAKLNDDEVERLHAGGPRTVVDYQVAWAKTYLKVNGYIESSSRGIWNLTEKGYSEKLGSKEDINSFVRNKHKKDVGNSDVKKKMIKEIIVVDDDWFEEFK